MTGEPDRPHDLYFEGEIPAPEPRPWAALADVEHVSFMMDAIGDPESWPNGWWGARVWVRTC